jgi:hypothetical protein
MFEERSDEQPAVTKTPTSSSVDDIEVIGVRLPET